MANTNHFAKSVSLVDYQPAFITGSNLQTWDWQAFTTIKQTDRLTEQVFSYTGLGLPRQTNQQNPFYFDEMYELGATTFTNVKYTLSTRFSYELLKYDKHVRDLAKKAGSQMGKSHAYLRDTKVAYIFNQAFSSTYISMYDSAALLATHTLNDGTSYDNALTAASLSFDNLWAMIDHFSTSTYNHKGLLINPKAKWLVTNPTNRQEVEKILESSAEPDTLANKNSLANKQITPIYCPHLSSTTAYFLLAEDFKDDLWFFNVESPRYIDEDDNTIHGTNFFSWQIFSVLPKEFINIVGNPGA